MDLNRKQFQMEFAGKPLTLEVSKLADQANGAVLGTFGETTVLATVVMSGHNKEGDFFPLTVNYEEKNYAVGKIMGGRFMKREGKSSDEAVLTGRLIDRAVRPLFDSRIRREIQLIVTVLSFDGENDLDFIGLLSASTALGISDIPWNGPVAGIQITKTKDKNGFDINPNISAHKAAVLDFNAFVSGTKERINMIEMEGNEANEAEVVKAFSEAQKEITKLVAFQEDIIKKIGKGKASVELAEPDANLVKDVRGFLNDKLEDAIYVSDKMKMKHNLVELKTNLFAFLKEKSYAEEHMAAADSLFEEEINNLIHAKILHEEKRPDGRKLNELRELYAETGLLKRLHGSALFVRGNTQSLALTTLGGPGDQQLMETMEFSGKKRFLLHYNFPPFSVGEIKPLRGPGRREIGHGALAEKALRAILPTQEQFPYTIRLVSEILSSNGSSSMATVCAGSLSLMDAGVPIRKPAAGIAMGLMLDEKGNDFKVLTDIQGPEDHHGDMDFKVAGTDSGVNAIQLDVKINGITKEMIEKTLAQAKEARLQILSVMTKALAAPRPELSPLAPSILTVQIDPLQIGEVIGPGGKMINEIIDTTGVTSIDIEDDGKVFITAPNQASGKLALERIQSMTKMYSIGDIVEGEVVKLLEFGAIVEFAPGRDGMIHISEIKDGFVKKIDDVIKVGDFVRAKIIKAENGKIGLSIKALAQQDLAK